MDPDRFRAAYQRLQNLDDRLAHKVRPRSQRTFGHATHEQLEERVRDLAEYTLELREIMDDMFQAIAAAPPGAQAQDGE
ncbi:MAG: hypothetical protein ACE5EG_07565 [Thermoanaerobaculia bacterium]